MPRFPVVPRVDRIIPIRLLSPGFRFGNLRVAAMGQSRSLNNKDVDHYTELARITTVKGARTSYFSPDLDRFFLAVRRQGSHPAAIEIFVPAQ